MKNVAEFSKVSLEQYTRDLNKMYPKYPFKEEEIRDIYNSIIIPKRATKKAAGYDFFTPFDFTLAPGCQIVIPTGIRVKIIEEDFFLNVVPKSRNVKTSIRLSNTVGIIDGDYYDTDNEGHIMIFLEMPVNNDLSTDSINGPVYMHWGNYQEKYRKAVKYTTGDGFVQGIFQQYGTVVDDELTEKEDRTGGFGSTGKEPVYNENGEEEL